MKMQQVCSRSFAQNIIMVTSDTIPYDTIRHINVHSKADNMASLVKRTAQKQTIKEN